MQNFWIKLSLPFGRNTMNLLANKWISVKLYSNSKPSVLRVGIWIFASHFSSNFHLCVHFNLIRVAMVFIKFFKNRRKNRQRSVNLSLVPADRQHLSLERKKWCCSSDQSTKVMNEKSFKWIHLKRPLGDILVRFYQLDSNQTEVWSAFVDSADLYVHHYCGIKFR